MAPANIGNPTSAPKTKKEKVYHPSSRKAGQLARNALRKGKLGNLASKRGKKHDTMVDVYGFFFHAMPDEGILSLEDLHHIVREIWLTRHDAAIEQEREERRKGRPKSTKELKLEEIKLREAEEYRTGMEIPDLTHPPTVEIFRRWDQKEVAFVQLLRFIRIFSTDPLAVVVSRPGKHLSIISSTPGGEQMEGIVEGQANS
ncbi:hypothetical protein BD779DRAFT_1437274 [Infundibulicybe gibba]|nr:hypothetical protein BD779DRAFT_1437274 [Infundibulicybe gibba]